MMLLRSIQNVSNRIENKKHKRFTRKKSAIQMNFLNIIKIFVAIRLIDGAAKCEQAELCVKQMKKSSVQSREH